MGETSPLAAGSRPLRCGRDSGQPNAPGWRIRCPGRPRACPGRRGPVGTPGPTRRTAGTGPATTPPTWPTGPTRRPSRAAGRAGRVRMVSRDASTLAVPPTSMPPGRGDQGGHDRPSELLDPARPAGPAQWSDPADRLDVAAVRAGHSARCGAAGRGRDRADRRSRPHCAGIRRTPRPSGSLRNDPGDDVSAMHRPLLLCRAPASASSGTWRRRAARRWNSSTARQRTDAAGARRHVPRRPAAPPGWLRPELGHRPATPRASAGRTGLVIVRSQASAVTGGLVVVPAPRPPACRTGDLAQDPHRSRLGTAACAVRARPRSTLGYDRSPARPVPGRRSCRAAAGVTQLRPVPARVPALLFREGHRLVHASASPARSPATAAAVPPVVLLVVAVLIAGPPGLVTGADRRPRRGSGCDPPR